MSKYEEEDGGLKGKRRRHQKINHRTEHRATNAKHITTEKHIHATKRWLIDCQCQMSKVSMKVSTPRLH